MTKRVRIIASKPRSGMESDLTELMGKEFPVLTSGEEGVQIQTKESPMGYFVYHDEYEVVEQKEAPGAVTP